MNFKKWYDLKIPKICVLLLSPHAHNSMLKNHNKTKLVSDWVFDSQWSIHTEFKCTRHNKKINRIWISYTVYAFCIYQKVNKSMIAIIKIISSLNHINMENRNYKLYQRDNIHLKTNVIGKAMYTNLYSVFALIRIKIILSLFFSSSHMHSFYSLHFQFSFHNCFCCCLIIWWKLNIIFRLIQYFIFFIQFNHVLV